MKENNPRFPRQAKGAITLTLAAVVLSSGLWALWYTPTTTYESRKNEQITSISFLLKPGNSAVKDFEVGREVQELSVAVWPQTIIQDTKDGQHLNIPPVISAKILDSQGKTIKSYDNVTSVPDDPRIPVQEPGTFKVQVSNNGTDLLQVELRAADNSIFPNHPMEAMGQWLTVISLPVFGLAGWFIVFRHRQAAPGS